MFAESLPNPESFSSIGWMLVIVSAVAFGANQVWKLIQSFKGTAAEPPNGQLGQSVRQLNARVKVLEQWRSDLISKMDDDKSEILAAGEHRSEKLHERINAVLTAVSEVKGTVHEMQRHLR